MIRRIYAEHFDADVCMPHTVELLKFVEAWDSKCRAVKRPACGPTPTLLASLRRMVAAVPAFANVLRDAQARVDARWAECDRIPVSVGVAGSM